MDTRGEKTCSESAWWWRLCCLWPLSLSAQGHYYRLVDLGVVGVAGGANHITNNGIASAQSRVRTPANDHAVIYIRPTDH